LLGTKGEERAAWKHRPPKASTVILRERTILVKQNHVDEETSTTSDSIVTLSLGTYR
jgi:hypothetical protein